MGNQPSGGGGGGNGNKSPHGHGGHHHYNPTSSTPASQQQQQQASGQQHHVNHNNNNKQHHGTGGGTGAGGTTGGGGGGGPYSPMAMSNTSHHHPQQQNQYQQQHPTTNNNNNVSEMRDRVSSDTSMTYNDDPPNNNNNNNANTNNNNSNNPPSNSQPIDIASLSAAQDETVPTVFRWEHGGRQVYITGTFNNWSRQIPMHRSGNDFTYIHNLKRGKHAFKFIVDDEWRFAPDQPTVADIDGRINNFIDVTDFKAYTGDKDFEREKAAVEYGCYYSGAGSTTGTGAPGGEGGETGDEEDGVPQGEQDGEGGDKDKSQPTQPHALRPDPDGEVFSQNMPDLDEYNKEPPPLPPHLRHIILNKPPQLSDTAALPVPQHVALNHLYCTAIKDNMMVLGITQRFRTKFVTTVYYSPCAS